MRERTTPMRGQRPASGHRQHHGETGWQMFWPKVTARYVAIAITAERDEQGPPIVVSPPEDDHQGDDGGADERRAHDDRGDPEQREERVGRALSGLGASRIQVPDAASPEPSIVTRAHGL